MKTNYMLPKKELNIYPKNEENLKALLEFYFADFDLPLDNAVQMLMNKSSLSLNQIDFIARKLAESWKVVFEKSFKNGTTVANLLRYGIEGLTKNESDWNFPPYSTGRPIVKEFLSFVRDSETDFNYLEKNN